MSSIEGDEEENNGPIDQDRSQQKVNDYLQQRTIQDRKESE